MVRVIVSLLLGVWLAVLLLGPLSNPIGSDALTRPLAGWAAPLHRALFMGHGYRFFAPNPGPSHLVEFTITRDDGTQVKGTFPDRDSIEPRLLYHRWFMLSETIFSEFSGTPNEADFQNLNARRKQEITAMRSQGQLLQSRDAEILRARDEVRFEQTIKRIDSLVKNVARYLLLREQGEEIELKVVTRTIPYPNQIRNGASLDDEQFLQYEPNPVIGRFSRDDLVDDNPVDDAIDQTRREALP